MSVQCPQKIEADENCVTLFCVAGCPGGGYLIECEICGRFFCPEGDIGKCYACGGWYCSSCNIVGPLSFDDDSVMVCFECDLNCDEDLISEVAVMG